MRGIRKNTGQMVGSIQVMLQCPLQPANPGNYGGQLLGGQLELEEHIQCRGALRRGIGYVPPVRRRKNGNAMKYPRGAKRRGRKSMISQINTYPMPRRLAPRRRKNDNAMKYPRGAKRRGRKSMICQKNTYPMPRRLAPRRRKK